MKIKENWDRQHRSCQVVGKDGQIEFDGVLKENEEVKIVNKKQVEAIKRKSKNKSEIMEHIQENEGSFVHLMYKYGYPLMDKLQTECEGNKNNIHVIRFIQLATYSTFRGNLSDKNDNRIKRSSLGKIWHTTSKNSIKETYDLLKKCGYIYETEEKYIMISKELIVKGAIEDFKKLHKKDIDLTYTRLFTQNIQDMYEGTDSKARKQLANLFKVLPFINFKHNVFCGNPTETDPKQLNLYTWTELARLCGYEDKKQVTRFKKDLMKLRIHNYEVIGQFETGSGKSICINPKVYYGGNNIEDVKRLYTMFEMCDGANKRG